MDNIDNKYNPQVCKILLAISDLVFLMWLCGYLWDAYT